MNTTTEQHWTNNSYADFAYRIASDFTAQIEMKLESLPMERKDYAKLVGVNPSRVSQILNDPGNLGLESMVRYARVLGMKVAVVAYEDGDSNNRCGPINAQIFFESWKKLGMPRDFFDLQSCPQIRDVDTTEYASNEGFSHEPINLLSSATTSSPTMLRR